MTAAPVNPSVGTDLQVRPLDLPIRRKRPRLPHDAYVGERAYHVVLTCQERHSPFSDDNLASKCQALLVEAANRSHFNVLAYAIMPDHVHILVSGTSPLANLLLFIKRFKQRTAYEYRQETGDPLWQQSFFDRILRDDESVIAIARYIWENPLVAGLVDYAAAYRWSGGSLFKRARSDEPKGPSLHPETAPSYD